MARKTVGAVLVDPLVAGGVKRVYGLAGFPQRDHRCDSGARDNSLDSRAARRDGRVCRGRRSTSDRAARRMRRQLRAGKPAPDQRVVRLSSQPRARIGHGRPEIGGGYFQESRPEQLFRECSQYCESISQPEQMPRILEIAMQTAVARRGVAVIVLPGNIAWKDAVYDEPRLRFPELHPEIRPSDEEIATLARMLNRALIEVAGKLNAPIVHAMRGKEFIEYDNPFDVGMTGLLGFASGYHAMMNCDTLLMLGTDFPYQQFYPERATVIQVDIRGEQIGRRTKVDLGLVGDVKATLQALLPSLEAKGDAAHLRASVEHYRNARKGLDDLATGEPGHTPIHPQYVARLIDELAAEDAIFACDVGTPTIWSARYLTMNGRRRLLGSFTHGSMASALPQAIGAQVSHPHRQVITLSGDGGLAMLLGDLLSLRQLQAPVKVVVFNNRALGFVELEMKAAGLLEFATDLRNPDFAALATAAGVLGLKADTPEQVRPMLVEALQHKGPALVDVGVAARSSRCRRRSNVIGFSLYLLKAVLSGHGDDILDLGKINLFR